MDLYLLRHAEAGEAPRDEDRALTDRGRKQARAAAAGIRWLDLGITALLSSPLVRAAQTAQPVAEALGLPVKTADVLVPGHDPAEALALPSADTDRFLLVGHEPQLSAIIRLATGGRVHMRKAMLVRLERPAGSSDWELTWALTWRQLERLGRS